MSTFLSACCRTACLMAACVRCSSASASAKCTGSVKDGTADAATSCRTTTCAVVAYSGAQPRTVPCVTQQLQCPHERVLICLYLGLFLFLICLCLCLFLCFGRLLPLSFPSCPVFRCNQAGQVRRQQQIGVRACACRVQRWGWFPNACVQCRGPACARDVLLMRRSVCVVRALRSPAGRARTRVHTWCLDGLRTSAATGVQAVSVVHSQRWLQTHTQISIEGRLGRGCARRIYRVCCE